MVQAQRWRAGATLLAAVVLALLGLAAGADPDAELRTVCVFANPSYVDTTPGQVGSCGKRWERECVEAPRDGWDFFFFCPRGKPSLFGALPGLALLLLRRMVFHTSSFIDIAVRSSRPTGKAAKRGRGQGLGLFWGSGFVPCGQDLYRRPDAPQPACFCVDCLCGMGF